MGCCARHTLALTSDGRLVSCGENASGQLGRTVDSAHPATTPAQVGAGPEWVAVACGAFHTVALKADGSLWSWGDNARGQLGLGDMTNRATPTRGGSATDWTAVDCGGLTSVALKRDGTLWAWGYNGWGQLGLGDTVDRLTPVRVGSASDWATVDSGGGHVLALKRDGTLWTWGLDESGQLGRTGDARSPGQVGAHSDWRIAVGGSDHSVAIKLDGTLWSWGDNGSGQLGRGGDTRALAQVGSASDWAKVACSHHTLALKTDGTIWSWGDNQYGQLGRSGATGTPAQVGSADEWAGIGGGRYHSLAVSRVGTLWSWGDNRNGQLGDGSMQNRPAPLDVVSLDGTPPTTVAGGVPSSWMRTKPVTVTLHAADAASGVMEIAYDLDGSSWTTMSGAGPVSVPVTLEGVTILSFRATDVAGNAESVQTATIRIDTVGPQTFALGAVTARKGARTTLRYRVDDVTESAAVTIKIFQGKKLRQSLAVGTQATDVDLGYVYRCTLAKGKYTWRVYARDLAGNNQTSTGATTLTVR
jgi:alpha-tubulin suppressor-like RCC1 family protein